MALSRDDLILLTTLAHVEDSNVESVHPVELEAYTRMAITVAMHHCTTTVEDWAVVDDSNIFGIVSESIASLRSARLIEFKGLNVGITRKGFRRLADLLETDDVEEKFQAIQELVAAVQLIWKSHNDYLKVRTEEPVPVSITAPQ